MWLAECVSKAQNPIDLDHKLVLCQIQNAPTSSYISINHAFSIATFKLLCFLVNFLAANQQLIKQCNVFEKLLSIIDKCDDVVADDGNSIGMRCRAGYYRKPFDFASA